MADVWVSLGQHGDPLERLLGDLPRPYKAPAATRLDNDEKDALDLIDTMGRMQRPVIISESGLYSLVLTSRKAKAKVFKRRITGTGSVDNLSGYTKSLRFDK